MKELEIQLEAAFDKVTPLTCTKIIQRICKMEDKFWDDDAKLERQGELLS